MPAGIQQNINMGASLKHAGMTAVVDILKLTRLFEPFTLCHVTRHVLRIKNYSNLHSFKSTTLVRKQTLYPSHIKINMGTVK